MAYDVLLLDVDNTLYPRGTGLTAAIDGRIERYLCDVVGIAAEDVTAVRRDLWAEFGTTLHGLMHRSRVDPADYVRFVHDVDHAAHVAPDPALGALLARIPMLKIAVTNGSRRHGEAVLECLGVRRLFFRVYGLEEVAYLPKPYVHAYHAVLRDLHAHAHDCVLVEDTAANVRAARQLGMWTVHVTGGTPPEPRAHAAIDTIHALEAALPT
jgi:putative hydrolase of the HAD superfamily